MDSAFELLAFVARSENRVEALQALEAGPASRAGLQEATGIPRATLSRILADFQARELANRDGYEFSITPLGRLLTRQLEALFSAIEVGAELQSLGPWLPLSELGIGIEDLADARVTFPTPVAPLAPVHRTAAVLEASDRVRGLCNNVIPELLRTLGDAIEAGIEIEVVATTEAFEVVSADPASIRTVRDLVDSGSLDLAICPVAFPQLAIDTDGTVLLLVTDDEGAIQGLVESTNEAVRAWFDDAFEMYRGQSDRVAPELLVG